MRRALLAAAAFTALATRALALDVPYLSGRVNDDAHLLDANMTQVIDNQLKAYEAKTGRQFVVLTIPSLENEDLEGFSIKTARTWKLGAKGKDDGILLLIVRDDHKVRIEVGYGLEGSLPDALCGRIIRDEIVPRFRKGNFADGINSGVAAVIQTLDGTYSPPPDTISNRMTMRINGRPVTDVGIMEKIMMSFFVFGILGLFEFIGLMTPGMGWFLYFFLIPFWAAFPMSIWGVQVGMGILAALLLGFPIVKLLISKSEWGQRWAKTMAANNARGHGYSSGGWSSGGGGSDSGFSGGGGSFGGGGASGSW